MLKPSAATPNAHSAGEAGSTLATAEPRSAGADPGPACYGNGGPLTVTDCNLVAGKLQPAFFPRVFGPDGDAAQFVVDERQQPFERTGITPTPVGQ